MEKVHIITERLIITHFDLSMVESVHLNSLDEDTRRFTPDEVFETIEQSKNTVEYLMECYQSNEGPFVYPILLKSGENIGYVQAVPISEGWEVGYHIASTYTSKGYAQEALRAFLPVIMNHLNIQHIVGISRAENGASCRVLEKCMFQLEKKYSGTYQGELHDICKYVYQKQ